MRCELDARTALPLKVLIVEDSLLLRQALAAILDELGGVDVVGGAEDEQSAIEMLQRQPPDLVIVDLELRDGTGLGVLRALQLNRERYRGTRAVVFSNYGQPMLREHCFALGIDRFFDKSTQMGDLLNYVQAAAPA